MIKHSEHTDDEIRRLIKNGMILFAGNARGKIYGRLNCLSGKRMKRETRVFFQSKDDAFLNGFRPCGHCMRDAYLKLVKRGIKS